MTNIQNLNKPINKVKKIIHHNKIKNLNQKNKKRVHKKNSQTFNHLKGF